MPTCPSPRAPNGSSSAQLPVREKELTRQYDLLASARRGLPMVRVDRDYIFEGPSGKYRLVDLFEDRLQLIVYHFMFDPAWEKGCPACTRYVDALRDLSMLTRRNTAFALISRAPFPKLETYQKERRWDRLWGSSFGSDFNYDFRAALDEKIPTVH
ncbi:MAG: DUF899 family protein [Undibacterium sp.]|nr:DUF899 family protein [Opitutaceae bacterium]